MFESAFLYFIAISGGVCIGMGIMGVLFMSRDDSQTGGD